MSANASLRATARNARGGQTARLVSECAGWSVQLLIVNLPAWFNNEQEKANAGQSHQSERDKKCFHELRSKNIE
jgi:hypothetical protein